MNDEIELSKRKCLPCEGGIDAIDHEQAKRLIKKLGKGAPRILNMVTSPVSLFHDS